MRVYCYGIYICGVVFKSCEGWCDWVFWIDFLYSIVLLSSHQYSLLITNTDEHVIYNFWGMAFTHREGKKHQSSFPIICQTKICPHYRNKVPILCTNLSNHSFIYTVIIHLDTYFRICWIMYILIQCSNESMYYFSDYCFGNR